MNSSKKISFIVYSAYLCFKLLKGKEKNKKSFYRHINFLLNGLKGIPTFGINEKFGLKLNNNQIILNPIYFS
jgi:hypothetical protein